MYGLIQFGGVLGTFAAVFVSVRTWAWATQADWLRSDWHTPPAWVRWLAALCIFAPREDARPPTMFRRSRLARLARRCTAKAIRLHERSNAAWRDRQYQAMHDLQDRMEIIQARAERFRMLARTIETGD
jgi:hypothetical protein